MSRWVVAALATLLLGCSPCSESDVRYCLESGGELDSQCSCWDTPPDVDVRYGEESSRGGGLGMSFRGRVGIQLGDTPFVITPDGLELGFGF